VTVEEQKAVCQAAGERLLGVVLREGFEEYFKE
jgi:hypothetical protein